MTGEELRELRVAMGISQGRLARMLGYSRWQTISEFENDRRRIPQGIAVAVRAIREDIENVREFADAIKQAYERDEKTVPPRHNRTQD